MADSQSSLAKSSPPAAGSQSSMVEQVPHTPVSDFLLNAAAFHRRLVAVSALEIEPPADTAQHAQQPEPAFKAEDLAYLLDQFQFHPVYLGQSQSAETGWSRQAAPLAQLGPAKDPLSSVVDACWKVSQDIAVRLMRCHKRNITAGGGPNGTTELILSAFPMHDVEVLGSRILELKDRFLNLQTNNESLAMTTKVSQINVATHPAKKHDNSTDSVPANHTDSAPGTIDQAQNGLKRPPRPAPAGILRDFILESLSFKSMTDREDEVTEAHTNTFDWLLNSEQPAESSTDGHGIAFAKWLQSDDLGPIYWITGKPGSGKSTLMRYISESKSANQMLKTWAGDSAFVKATFYFWTSGSAEQRSQTGLLRYLLYQLLSYDPEMMPEVFPDLWKTLSTMSTKERIQFSPDWTVTDLTAAFHRYLDRALPDVKVCLFVDGLDEFDGNHHTIVHFFRDLTDEKYGNQIKLCLSSRPWAVFSEAFQASVPNMRLQDLTYKDMVRYVTDNLLQDETIVGALQKNFDDSKALINRVVHQADGVFLWVRLVVRKLLETFTGKYQGLEAMQEYLRGLPTDLDLLFDKLLFQTQSEAQMREMSEMFQMIRARETVAAFVKDESANSLTIWEFAFARMSQNDDLLAINRPVSEAPDKTIIERCKGAQQQVEARSAGLLDVFAKRERQSQVRYSRPSNADDAGRLGRWLAMNRITYLHRTVRDYLMLSPGVWSRLVACAADTFDPHLRLLRSYVLRLKHSLEEIEHHRRLDEWYSDIVLALTHARYIIKDYKKLQTPFINELDKTLDWYWAKKSDGDHWSLGCFGTYEERRGNKIIIPHPFIALCTKFGLERYVLDQLDSLSAKKPKAKPKAKQDQESVDADAGVDEDEEEYHDSGDAEVEEMPLLARALEFLTSRQKTIFPLSSTSFVDSLIRRKFTGRFAKLVGTANGPFNSPLTGWKKMTPWILVLRHLRDAKRRGWIEPFDIDEDGTKRWTAILGRLVREGGADRKAVVAKDGWDGETSVGELLGSDGELQVVGDFWIYEFAELCESDAAANGGSGGKISTRLRLAKVK